MNLSNLTKLKGTKSKKIRLGRGIGSGKGGHTVGFGMKGQKSRSGNSIPVGFEGGQLPTYRKLPTFGGFNNPTKKDIVAVSFSDFNSFDDGITVTPLDLVKSKRLKKLPRHGVKILNSGALLKKISFEGFAYSKTAKEKIESLPGCSIK
ncbi:MAG: 50S ribosomal protein L15 [Patescibacteria group bacterium]